MGFPLRVKQIFADAWRGGGAHDETRQSVQAVQVERALAHVPMIYAVAIFNMIIVIALCVHEQVLLAQYGWMGVVLLLSIARMIWWFVRDDDAAKTSDPAKMLRIMTLVSVGIIAALSGWTVYASLSGMLTNMTLIPISLVFGSSCIAHCLAPIRKAAVSVLLAGVVPVALVLAFSHDFETRLLGLCMLSITFLMIRFILASYNQIISGIKMEQQIRELAHSDPLTGLANRRAMMLHLEGAERSGKEAGGGFAVAMLDLDGFKQINDSFGHHVGDALLIEVAQRLSGAALEGEYVGRLGGDEFIFLLPGIEDAAGASERVTAYLSALARPTAIDGHMIPMAASMGFALYTGDQVSLQNVLKKADEALYLAKDNRRVEDAENNKYQLGWAAHI